MIKGERMTGDIDKAALSTRRVESLMDPDAASEAAQEADTSARETAFEEVDAARDGHEHQDHEHVHDHGERPDRMQICEIAGDSDVFEGWLTIPLHVIDKGQFPYRHVEIFFDLDMAVELIDSLHFMIHEEIAQRSKAVAGLKRQAKAAES